MEGLACSALVGNLALVSHRGGGKGRAGYWFADWRLAGEMLALHPERRVGPILATLHTLSEGRLGLSAVVMPLSDAGSVPVRLERLESGGWRKVAQATAVASDWTAVFVVNGRQADRDCRVRVCCDGADGSLAVHEATIRREPVFDDELVLAALSCVHQNRFGFGRAGYPWNEEALWFPHADLAFECWPRHAVPGRDPQFAGWPRSVAQREGAWSSSDVHLPPLVLGSGVKALARLEQVDKTLVYAR
jgi:hypothetical protein